MVMEALVYILTLLFGVSTVIIIKNKRYKVVPFICLDIILTFAGFAITSFVILFVGNEALEALLHRCLNTSVTARLTMSRPH